MISSSVIENTLLLILVSQHIHTFFRAEKGCGQKKKKKKKENESEKNFRVLTLVQHFIQLSKLTL